MGEARAAARRTRRARQKTKNQDSRTNKKADPRGRLLAAVLKRALFKLMRAERPEGEARDIATY